MHYSVVVATRKNSTVDIDSVLAPYNSQPEGREPWLEFEVVVEKGKFREEVIRIIDETKGYLRKGRTDGQIKNEAARLNMYEKYLYDRNYTGALEEYHGGTVFMGDWGYWNNPRGFWDWYEIGGRWANYFKLKKGAKNYKGHQASKIILNLDLGDAAPKDGYADSAPLKYIDWDGKRLDAEKEAGMLYEKVVEQMKSGELKKEKYALTAVTTGITIKTGRLEPKSKFIKRCGGNGLIPYAFIDEDGILHEKVWDASLKTDRLMAGAYEKKWEEFLKNADQDTMLTIVDCHN